jgi:hypothetical protein
MFPLIHPVLVQNSGLRAAVAHRSFDAKPSPEPRVRPDAVEVRLAWPADAPGLVRLAQLDSAPAAAAELPGLAVGGEVLVAIVDGELAAALSLKDGLLVSDPFHRTDSVIALLHVRAAQLARAERRPRLARLGVLLPRLH